MAADACTEAQTGNVAGGKGKRTRVELGVALGAFETRMVRRAGAKVEASAKAAKLLHSGSALRPAVGRETRARAAAAAGAGAEAGAAEPGAEAGAAEGGAETGG